MALRESPAGRPAPPVEDPRAAVAWARGHVLRGRGPGADTAETARYQRERPNLGPFPAPMERELVHLNAAAFRSGRAPDADETAVQNQLDRLRSLWCGPRTRAAESPVRRTSVAASAGFVLGAAAGLAAARLPRRSH